MAATKPLLKGTIEYVRGRVGEVTKCTNGKIVTNLNNKKKTLILTLADKMKQIRSNKAKLRSLEYLREEFSMGYSSSNNKNFEIAMNNLFKFTKSDIQKKAETFNKAIDSQIDERQTEVELAGKRLIDRCSLGLIPLDDLPNELEILARMSD